MADILKDSGNKAKAENQREVVIYEEKKTFEIFKKISLEHKMYVVMVIGTELQEQGANVHKAIRNIEKIISLRMLVDKYRNNKIMKCVYLNKYLEALRNCKET